MVFKSLLRWFSSGVIILLGLVLWGACTPSGLPLAPTSAPVVTPQATAPAKEEAPPTLTILYTDDEHGWMAGKKEGSGAANLLGLWRESFGYDANDPSFLVLSGGDNWTGPAISTWFKGESMAQVMNLMGYDASAVGNHEFDFGLEAMKSTIASSVFPYLAANMVLKSTGQPPTDLGVQPYAIFDTGQVRVGVIGLANAATPKVTNPANVKDFDFAPYISTLETLAPEVRAQGADVLIVISHLCNEELRYVAAKTKALDILVFGGGHCHQTLAEQASNAVLLTGGPYLATYAWARLWLDDVTMKPVKAEYGVEANHGGPADPEIAALVQEWQAKTDEALGEPIGYLAHTLPERSPDMLKLVTETWLLAYPQADVAITNSGGVRDALRAGPVTIADLISMMPFDNVLIDMRMTGDQLLAFIENQGPKIAVGGLHRQGMGWALNRTGERIDRDKTYRVLVNDYMYAGGGTYQQLAQFDPAGYDTGIDWRQPVIDWIIAQQSSPERPLNDAIAALGAPGE